MPAWDKGLPQTDAKTNWPAPSATTPADQIKATPVATGPAAEGGKVTPQLMDAIEKIESSGNPNAVTGQYKGLFQLSDKQFADYGGKGSIFDPTENRRVAELVINDEAKNLSKDLGRAVTPSEIYLAHQQGYGGAAAHLKNPDQPAWKSMASTAEGQEKGEAWAKQAIWGNIPDDAKAKFGSVENVKSGDFVNLWKEKGARLGIPATAEAAQPAGPGSGPLASPADKGSPVATLRDAVAPGTAGTVDVGGGQISPVDSATPSAAAFEKGGAPAVPYHGVGGMYGPEYEASTTSATLSGPDTQALNAIKKPTASAQAVAAPPAATAPPATPGAVAAPPSQPPGTAAAPPPPAPVRTAAPPPAPPRAATPPLTPAQVAKPLSGYDKARAMVDQPLRQILSPEELKQVPESYQGQTPRQIYNTPLVGGIAMTKMEPLFKQKGFTRDDAMKALSTPPDQPGKRSDAGTSSGLLDKAQGMAATERGAPGPQYAQADTGVRSDASPGPAPESGARAPWANDARLAQMAYQPTEEPWSRVDAQRQSSPETTAYVQKQMADERAGRDAAWADMRRAPIEDRRGQSDLHGKISGTAAEIMDKSGIGDLVDIATGNIPDYIKARFTDPAQTPLGVQAGLNDLKSRQEPGTSDVTDFSSRGRTPMAPPGLDGKVPLPQPGPRTENRNAAQVEMNLTPEERALYQRHIDNLNGPGGVDNPDGSRSSLYQTVEEHDGKFYNVPTVWDGKIQTEKWTDPKSGKTFDIPNKTALDNINKTGWDKFPAYATPEQADARYEQMHGYMDKDTGAYLAGRGQPQAPQQPQQPQSAAPQITPEMAKAIENAVKIDSGPPVVAQPDAQPVLTSSQPGDAGAGLSLAPSGLQNLPAGLAAPGAGPMQSAFMPGSQGGGIAMLGVQPQTGVFSTPLLDSAVQQPAGSFAAGSLSPIAPQFMGWGGGFGGTSGGSGFGGMYGDSMLGSEVGMGNTMGSMFGSG